MHKRSKQRLRRYSLAPTVVTSQLGRQKAKAGAEPFCKPRRESYQNTCCDRQYLRSGVLQQRQSMVHSHIAQQIAKGLIFRRKVSPKRSGATMLFPGHLIQRPLPGWISCEQMTDA